MLSVRKIVHAVGLGQITAQQAIADSVAAIAAREPDVQAFASLAGQPAPGQGPLAGIAVGVKDIIDTAGLPTGMGSPVYQGWQPKADAAIVCALKAAGATVIGKTETTAFAFLDPARTRNPHDLTATPGGSSAGSAAAVAAGMVPLAVGTQTGGSVIRPASYCGVAAIKPSFGILPTVGIKCFSWSLDTPGLFAASAGDLALALALMTGRDDLDGPVATLRGLKLGVLQQPFAGAAEPSSRAALERAEDIARKAGATIVGMQEPEALALAYAAHGTIQDFEASQALAWEYAEHGAMLPPKLHACLAAAKAVKVTDYDIARRFSRRGRDAARGFFGEVDAFISFSAPGEAPAGHASTGEARFNKLWTLLGVPCVGLPVMRGERGLPVSIQIITGFGQDAAALAIARALETAISTQELSEFPTR
jgi:Asp-tRNA(Asn)/Glu-tRNA(Gln) amidotransferase A subunit family amidase